MDGGDYRAVNRANWDDRADLHVRSGYGIESLLASPDALSGVVEFDLPRLGRLDGLDVVHLQCHIGTDTLSLARLGASSVTGVDLSPRSLAHAATLAGKAGVAIEYVEADVYDAPRALGGRRFDLVYTSIGALCWLPSISRWAATVAELLRPGGRLFVRDTHPAFAAMLPVVLRDDISPEDSQPGVSDAGDWTLAAELPYFERAEPLVWDEPWTYVPADSPVDHSVSMEWNHGLGETVTALLDAGMEITSLTEHDTVPWLPFKQLMAERGTSGEYGLVVRPWRLPVSFTLTARRR